MTDYTGPGGYYENRITAAKVVDTFPNAYRLGITPNGGFVLQGEFLWRQGNTVGSEWRTLPTVIVDA